MPPGRDWLLSAVSPGTSAVVLLTLSAVLGASSLTFWLLVRRWTSRRQWVGLSEWAREAGFRFRDFPDQPPPPLDALPGGSAAVRICLADRHTMLVQVQAELPASLPLGAIAGLSAAQTVLPRAPGGDVSWNLLVRGIQAAWPPTGLRPTGPTASFLDLFSLSSFPLMGSTERFVVHGKDSAAARLVSASSLRSLLPPDIGLLLHGPHLVLDFSTRPFDVIEFNRLLALADQLAGRLPAPELRASRPN